MAEFFSIVKNSILQFTFKDAIDIILVAILIYGAIRLTRKTRAFQVLKGLAVVVVCAQLANILGLTAISWLLQTIINAGAVLLVIVFQPEIRRALEKIGRGRLFGKSSGSGNLDEDRIVNEISRAVLNMSIRKVGALIVFEMKTGLREVTESGTPLNAEISAELIENIFVPGAPLHDGALIIHGNAILAAGCFLPLSDNKQISSDLGTRHRAALGVSEVSDAYVIIVSEETGIISIVHDGAMTRYLTRQTLMEKLHEIYAPADSKSKLQGLGTIFKRKENDK